MKIIGITGGIGAGKSSVLDYMKEKHHTVICQADQVARNLEKKGTKCYKKIVEQFGTDILCENGRIDRNKLAQIVFSDADKLKELNAIVHPAVKEKIQSLIKTESKKGTALFVIEAALLIEDHYDEICDETWFVYAETEVRRRRLMTSRGYTQEKTDAILASQMKSSEFLSVCDRAIDNSDTFEETCIQVDKLVRALA